MALSGVRNRRPVKPLPRGEIKKRRKQLRAELAEQDPQERELPKMPGSDLIEAPPAEPFIERRDPEREPAGLMSRFRRRKNDVPLEVEVEEESYVLPTPVVTVHGGRQPETDPIEENAVAEDTTYEEADDGQFIPSPPEHSSATAILEQLKEHEATSDDTWLPPVGTEASASWTLPDLPQSPLGGNSGTWAGVADRSAAGGDEAFDAPVFVSEAQLEAAAQTTTAAPAHGYTHAPEDPNRKADTDGSGNWVPPTLRGMEPQAMTNGGELPRRRRRTEADEQN